MKSEKSWQSNKELKGVIKTMSPKEIASQKLYYLQIPSKQNKFCFWRFCCGNLQSLGFQQAVVDIFQTITS